MVPSFPSHPPCSDPPVENLSSSESYPPLDREGLDTGTGKLSVQASGYQVVAPQELDHAAILVEDLPGHECMFTEKVQGCDCAVEQE